MTGTAPRAVLGDQHRLLTLVLVGPIAGFLLASALTGAELHSMWGGPLWTFFPVWVLLVSRPTINRLIERRALVTGLVVCTLMAAISAGVDLGGPYFRSRISRHHAPTRSLAAAVQSAWQDHVDGPLPIVAGPYFHSCLVNMYHPDRPAVYYDAQPELAPWTSDEAMRRLGGVLVWKLKGRDSHGKPPELPAHWAKRFPNAIVSPVKNIPPLTGASVPPLKYAIAVIPPSRRLASEDDSLRR